MKITRKLLAGILSAAMIVSLASCSSPASSSQGESSAAGDSSAAQSGRGGPDRRKHRILERQADEYK